MMEVPQLKLDLNAAPVLARTLVTSAQAVRVLYPSMDIVTRQMLAEMICNELLGGDIE